MIENLPPEILLKIFGNLRISDLLTTSLVCQKWRRIASLLIVDRVKIVITEELESVIDVLQKSTVDYKHWLFKGLYLSLNERFKSIWSNYASNAASIALVDVEIYEKDLWNFLSDCTKLIELTFNGLDSLFMTAFFLDKKSNQSSAEDIFSNLKTFYLTGSRYLSDATFSHLTSQLKSLETFSLNDCQISYEQSIYKRFYPQSKSITVSPYVFTFKYVLSLIELNASTLKHISFSRTAIDNQSLNNLSLIKKLNLKSLELIACNQLTRLGIQNLVENQRNLTRLDLSFCARITDYGIIAIVENIPRLKHLNLCRCQSVTEVGLGLLRKLKHLEWLDISRLVISNSIHIHEALGIDVRLPLKWLNCSFLVIACETVCALVNTAPNLEHLDLSICKFGVTDKSIQSICKLKNLKSLDISGCISFSDFGLSGQEAYNTEGYKVPDKIKTEQQADVIFLEAGIPLHSPPFTKLSDLKGLRTLGLSGCVHISNITLTTAISFNELYALNLSRCKEIDDCGLIPMVNRCPALEEVILDDCFLISDQAILVIAHRLRRLKILSLQSCTRLTDDSMDSLSNCTALRYLDVNNCFKITGEQLKVLKNRLPRLSNLYCRHVRMLNMYCEVERSLIPTPPPPLL